MDNNATRYKSLYVLPAGTYHIESHR